MRRRDADHPGLVAPAEQLVSCDHPELADLPAQLLGRTLIVRDLAAARAIAAHAPGFRLVTLQGELLEPDGTLTVGTHHAETGILSRKSELRELREQAAGWTTGSPRPSATWPTCASALRGARTPRCRSAAGDRRAGRAGGRPAQPRRAAPRAPAGPARGSDRQPRRDAAASSRRSPGWTRAWQQAQAQAAEAEAQVQQLHRPRAPGRRRDAPQREQRTPARSSRRAPQAQVALAKVEERLRGLQAQHQQLARDLTAARQELDQGAARSLATRQARLPESQLTMLRRVGRAGPGVSATRKRPQRQRRRA